MWGSELSLPWENFCDGIIFQFLGHSRCTRFDYITNVLHLSPRDFLSLDVEYLFGRFQSFLFMAIQKLVVTDILMGGSELTFFYSSILFSLLAS